VFPRPEFTEYPVHRQFSTVSLGRCPRGNRERELPAEVATKRGEIELALECVERGAAPTVNNMLVVWGPSHNDVVWPHPVGYIVTAQGGGVGNAFGLAARCRDDKHFGIAIVLAGKGNMLAIVAETGE